MQELIGLASITLAIGGGADPENELPQYRFGVTPWQHGQSEDDIRSLYKPLLEWLGRRVQAKFIILGAGSYDEMIDLLANELIHLGAISPTPFVLAQQRNPRVRMLVTELSWDIDEEKKSPTYEALIVARADRDDLSTLESLRDRRFGFVRRQSTSGYVYPAAYFKRHGIDYELLFSRVYFLGANHELQMQLPVAASMPAPRGTIISSRRLRSTAPSSRSLQGRELSRTWGSPPTAPSPSQCRTRSGLPYWRPMRVFPRPAGGWLRRQG